MQKKKIRLATIDRYKSTTFHPLSGLLILYFNSERQP